MILLCVPWLAGGERWVWELGLEQPPAWSLGIPVPGYLLLVWWLIAMLLVLNALVHLRGVHKKIRALPIIDATEPIAMLDELSQRLGVKRGVVLRVGMEPCSTTMCVEDGSSVSRSPVGSLVRRPGATIILPTQYRCSAPLQIQTTSDQRFTHDRNGDENTNEIRTQLTGFPWQVCRYPLWYRLFLALLTRS